MTTISPRSVPFGCGGISFNFPEGIGLDKFDNIYVANTGCARIDKFDSEGNFLSRFGSSGSADGQFFAAWDVAIDGEGNIFVGESNNLRIQKFDSSGNFLLKFGERGSSDGQFGFDGRIGGGALDVALDSFGNVYVVDNFNGRIQKFDNDGNFLLKIGTKGSGDGQFNSPFGVGVDNAGNIYVADTGNQRVQIFDPEGNFLFKFGTGIRGSGDGEFSGPVDVAVDGAGTIYVADTSNNRIQVWRWR